MAGEEIPKVSGEHYRDVVLRPPALSLNDEEKLAALLQLDRLHVHADYLDRQGRRSLADDLRKTIRAARLLDLLNDYTKEILDDVAEVPVPAGCEMKISADADVIFARPDGHWIGLVRLGATPGYVAWRGSLYRGDRPFPTLGAAVLHYSKETGRATVPDED